MRKKRNHFEQTVVFPKLCGADIELGNFIRGVEQPGGTGFEASHALLAEIQGYPTISQTHLRRPSSFVHLDSGSFVAGKNQHGSLLGASLYNPQDISRQYLATNGGCAYIDLNHLELCTPEVVSAFDHVAAWHAMLRIARSALDRANRRRSENRQIEVLINNSDGLGSASYGSHLSCLISRRCYEDIFRRKLHFLQFLASFQVSSILLTGQGKVGAENGRPNAHYQISQRADYFEVLHGIQTTFNRPIVNSRDEALCGAGKLGESDDPARLHVIFNDSALAHGSALFRVGTMQLMLTLIERGLVNARLILEDPLEAVLAYSHDPSLRARARLIGGEELTAVELQCAYLEEVKRHAAHGAFDGVVPRAEEIIALWEDTVVRLAIGDLMALAPRLDWVMKLAAIERAIAQNPEMTWSSPAAKVIDHMYASLGSDGLYWAYEAGGLTERLVTENEISTLVDNPPRDSRAWTRAMLLRRAEEMGVEVEAVNWDRITFRVRGPRGWSVYRTVEMENPLCFNEAAAGALFAAYADFNDLLDSLDTLRETGAAKMDSTAVQSDVRKGKTCNFKTESATLSNANPVPRVKTHPAN